MIIYILLMLSVPIWSLIVKNKKWYALIISAEIFLILALRADTLGVDLDTYRLGYRYISTLTFPELLRSLRLFDIAELVWPMAFESGYAVLNWLVSFFGIPFHGFLMVYAAFFAATMGWFIYRYSDIPWLSFAVMLSMGFFEYSFGILRQTLAMCILLYATEFLRQKSLKKKILPCLLLLFAAFTVHRAAIVFLAIYVLSMFRINRKAHIIFLCGEAVFLVVSPWLYRYVLSAVMEAIGKPDYAESSFSLNFLIALMLLIAVAVAVTVNFKELSGVDNLAIWALHTAILLEILGMNQDVFARIVYLPFVYIILLIPNTIWKYPHPKLTRIAKPALYVALACFMVYQLRGAVIVPYVPFWSVAA